jgi:hypothetical protein
MLGVLENRLDIEDTALAQVLSYAFLAAMGLAMALLVSMMARAAMREGSFIWVLPVGLEIAAVIWQLFSEGVVSTLHGLFFTPGPGLGEESWGMVLLTLPTWSCCSYSATMWWRLRRGDGT